MNATGSPNEKDRDCSRGRESRLLRTRQPRVAGMIWLDSLYATDRLAILSFLFIRFRHNTVCLGRNPLRCNTSVSLARRSSLVARRVSLCLCAAGRRSREASQVLAPIRIQLGHISLLFILSPPSTVSPSPSIVVSAVVSSHLFLVEHTRRISCLAPNLQPCKRTSTVDAKEAFFRSCVP